MKVIAIVYISFDHSHRLNLHRCLCEARAITIRKQTITWSSISVACQEHRGKRRILFYLIDGCQFANGLKQYRAALNVIGRIEKRAWSMRRSGEIEKHSPILLWQAITMYNLDICLTVTDGLVTFCDREVSCSDICGALV